MIVYAKKYRQQNIAKQEALLEKASRSKNKKAGKKFASKGEPMIWNMPRWT